MNDRLTDLHQHRTLRFAASLAWAVSWILAATSLTAQETTPVGFRAYRLEHADAGQVADQIKNLAASADEKLEILLDRQLNRVLIKGSAEAHQVARELVTALDKPGPQGAPVVAPPEKPILKSYRAPDGQLEPWAERLQREYGATEGVRIAPDLRTNQLLVLAPPASHQQIARTLNAPASLAAATGPLSPAAPVQPQAPALQPVQPGAAAPTYRFRSKTWREMEDLLRQTWGPRLTVSLERNGELAIFRLTTSSGGETTIAVDRRNEAATIQGPPHLTSAALQVLQALDAPPQTQNTKTQVVSVRNAEPEHLRRAASLLEAASQAASRQNAVALPAGGASQRWGGDLLAMIFQQQAAQAGQPQPPQPPNAALNQPAPNQPQPGAPPQPPVPQPVPPPGAPPQPGPNGQPPAAGQAEAGGFIGPVRIEFVEGLDALIITGDPRDVERVQRIIRDILDQTRETAPAIEVYYLQYVDSQTLATLITPIYDAVLAVRQGSVSITPLVQPNALLLIGRPDNVASVIELVKKLDQPLTPEAEFELFMLKHASALEVEQLLKSFYNEGQALPTGAGAAAGAVAGQAQLRPGLGTRLRIVSDYRTNSLVVLASPRDLEEIRRLVSQLDVPESKSNNEIRIIRLRNSLAQDLAPVLEEAITGQPEGQLGQQQVAQQAGVGQAGRIGQLRSRMLTFMTIDQEGGRLLKSGILTDVRVVADPRANTLIVTAPAESMDLIMALVRELDELPAAEAQVKVFTILNGDAQGLADMLQQLFGQQQQQQAGALALQTAAGAGESTLVPLRFAVDLRTNSIIATGAAGDLTVVEAILLRLDESDIQQRRTRVFRLRYAFAQNVADAITELLQQEQQILAQQPGLLSAFEQIQREVVVVPEVVTNSLIVSATPRFYDEVVRIVEDLDRRPPMVVIQVVIAEVTLSNIDEFGAEFGLQDSLLFSRSGVTNGTLTPGFNFNNAQLGNSPDPASLATREDLAGQALSHFSLGRVGQTGYGGLVLSASNESVSILLRALQEDGRARILSRPQVMTLDNLGAFIQRGSQVPFPGQQTVGVGGQVSVNTNFANVGLILGVTPRVTPDGLIVMEVDAENSSVSEFVPIGNGGVAPQIDLSRAQTTVSARSGQTVILGGIIATSRIFTSRGIPYLSDLPVLGRMFRFDSQNEERRELLIILTPFVVNNEYEMERIKQAEFARMNWCLADVIAIHGDIGGQNGSVLSGHDVIFPDMAPTAAEIIPVPEPGYMPSSETPGAWPPGVVPPGAAPPAMVPPTTIPPRLDPAPAPPGYIPTPAPRGVPAPVIPQGELPLAPPGPMSGPVLEPSSRRMDSAYVPPSGFPVAPAAYQAPPQQPWLMR